MGHTHGIKWTEQLIEDKIRESMSILDISRMPTRQEIIDTVGNPVACKITKTHGYYGWAEKLGIPVKDSDSTTGRAGEFIAKSKLEELGFTVEKMSTKYPFDLLVDDIAKVDVKYSRLYTNNKWNFYSFHLEKRYPTCDFYILVAECPDGSLRYFVVPAVAAHITQISIGEFSGGWYRYENRYDLLSRYIDEVSKIQ